MEYYLLEAALLMLAAYLVGATLGCILRRLLTSDIKETARPLERPASATAATASVPTATIRDAPEPVQPKIETVAQSAPPKDSHVSESARFERVLTSSPAIDEAASSTATAAAAAVAATASAAAAGVAAKAAPEAPSEPRFPSAGGSSGQSAVAVPAFNADTQPADDLRRLSGVDDTTAAQLNQLGVTRFAQIADWRAQDVSRVANAFGDTRATTGTWAEQAKILAAGKDTVHLQRLAGAMPAWSIWSLPSASPEACAAAAASAAATAAAIAAAAPPEPVVEPVAEAPPAAAPKVVDDLTRIRGIDAGTAAKLNAGGISNYSEIAAWKTGDVARFDGLVGQAGRISSENWIEQAKVLATGKGTAFTQSLTRGLRTARLPAAALPSREPLPQAQPVDTQPPASTAVPEQQPAPAAETAIAASAATAVAASALTGSAPTGAGDDLTEINGIDASVAAILNENGVRTHEQISNWSAAHVAKVDGLLGKTGRVSAENWIEQAKILAGGNKTAFTRGATNAQFSAQAYRAGAIAASSSVATAPVADEDDVPTIAMPQESAPSEPAPAAATDAAATSAAPARPARLADAIRQNKNVGGAAGGVAGMRSVRSQLLSGDKPTPDTIDDLKKIRGIGVLIEKKLNAMGVFNYDQIANWSAGDIERISSALDFKGRIEREGWVQQARILASGGQTEFSKRLT